MTSVASETSPKTRPWAMRWPEWLVLVGGAALLAGLVLDQTWDALPAPERIAESLVLVVLALVPALALRAWRGWLLADGVLLVAVAALVVFAGPLPVLATAFVATTAIALGRWARPVGVALPVGLALVAGIAGWLLPLPVHRQWGYGLAMLTLLAWRWRDLRAAFIELSSEWRVARAAAPRASCAALLLLFLASAGCWLPTMQYDDVAYHLGLPYQLQQSGEYVLDPTHQIWALAPWAGDVLQGIAQVLADREARGAINAMWLGLAAMGIYRLSGLLGGSPQARWSTVALFATLPLTLSLSAGMQTELPAAAVLVWLACVIADDRQPGARQLFAGALLFGLAGGLKLMHVAVALPLLGWAAWRHRAALGAALARGRGWARLASAAGMVAMVGGTSYAYAWAVAGNPILPLMNATFRSTYFPHTDFVDQRWQQGYDLALPWEMTFDTGRYLEGYDGAMGFVLVAALGAWLLALVQPRTRAFTIAATLGLAVSVFPAQYARYAYPSLVLLLPAVVVALHSAMPAARAALLVVALCLLQLLFHGNGYWMIRNGAIGDTVQAGGADAPLLEQFTPERVLLSRLREAQAGDGRILVLGTDPDAFAELGRGGRTVSWYAPDLNADAAQANADASGRAWAALIRREGITDILLRDASLQPAQRAGLARLGARRVDVVDVAERWQVPRPSP